MTTEHYADFLPLPQKMPEIKGYLCGFIAGGVHHEGKPWLETLNGLFHLRVHHCELTRHVLINLYKDIAESLHSRAFDLRSFIFRRKKLSFASQLWSLKQWCIGFLSGFPSETLPDAISQKLRKELQSFEGVSAISIKKMLAKEKNKKLFCEALDFIEYTLFHIHRLLNEAYAKH